MRRRLRRFAAVLKMVQNPFYDLRLFDTGDHFDGTPALLTGFDIDLEHAFEALRPAHGSIALGGGFELVGGPFTASGRCHL